MPALPRPTPQPAATRGRRWPSDGTRAPQPRLAREERREPRAAAPAPGRRLRSSQRASRDPRLAGARQLPARPGGVITARRHVRPVSARPGPAGRCAGPARGGSGPARPAPHRTAPPPAPPRTAPLSGCPWGRGAEALPAGGAWLQKSLAPCWAMPRRTRTRGG